LKKLAERNHGFKIWLGQIQPGLTVDGVGQRLKQARVRGSQGGCYPRENLPPLAVRGRVKVSSAFDLSL
jgi:hypothetical protein